MGMGACDPCRKARSRCDQTSPSCNNCVKKNRKCSYVAFILRNNPCLICRDRKKKCDRQKPYCLRCERLGFECRYPQRGSRDASHDSSFSEEPTIVSKSRTILNLPLKLNSCAFQGLANDRILLYDKDLRKLIINGKTTINLNPLIFIRELFSSLKRGDQVIFFGEQNSVIPSQLSHPTFLVTKSLVNHLVNLFFVHINPYHPILSESYFRNLLQTEPHKPNTQLLVNTICLSASCIFPVAAFCGILKHAFSRIVFTLLKKCYLTPTISLIQTYLLLSSISITELDHPQANPQRYYFSQAVLLFYLLGIHLKSHPPNSNPSIKLLRANILLSAYVTETVVSSQTFELASPVEPEYIKRSLTTRTGIDLTSPEPLRKLKMGFFRIADKSSLQLQFLNFMNVFYCELIQLQKPIPLSPPISNKSLGSKNNIGYSLVPGTPILKLENILHKAMLKIFCVAGKTSKENVYLTVPSESNLTNNFTLYLCCLIDIYRPFLSFKISDISTINLRSNSIKLSEFIKLNHDAKCLLAASLFSRTLLKHKHNFLFSGIFYKWGRLMNVLLLLQSFSNSLVNHPLSSLIKEDIQNLINILDEGKLRWEAARIVQEFSMNLLNASNCNLRITSRS